MKKIVLFFMLLLLSSQVLADSNVPSLFTAYTTPATDLSIQYLGLLFGNVSSVLHGGGSSLMGKLFMVLNKGILVITGVWLSYTAGQMVFQAANEGALNSPQRKTTFVLLRMAAGFALIIPNAATGYSPVQDIVMKVTTEGVRLADDTWSYALQYIENGGFVYNEQSKTSVASQMPSIKSAFTALNSPVQSLVNSEVCMYLSTQYSQQNPKASQGRTQPYLPVYKGNEVYFPGLGNANSWTPGQGQAACGSVTSFAPKNTAQQSIATAALSQMVQDVAPYSQDLARSIATGQQESGLQTEAVNSMSSSVLDYLSVVAPTIASKPKTKPAFFAMANANGWFNAGSFYWDLSQYNDSLGASGKYSSTPPSVMSSVPENSPDQFIKWDNQAATNITSAMPAVNKALDLYATNQGQGQSAAATGAGAAADPDNWGYVCSDHGWGTCKYEEIGHLNSYDDPSYYDAGPGLKGLSNLIPDSIAGLAGDIYQYEQAPSASNRSEFYNPISFIMHIGADCLGAAGHIWGHGATIILDWSIAAGICTAVSPGATILQSLLSWLTPLFMGSALALFAAGFMMAFYAPLYPYMLFLFGAMSWLLYVIEAMVAAPLVCFGMTHPEGHDFLGRSEQALMLLLGVFLRPVLMVIGFVAAMILTYVGFAIVNFGFSHVLREVFDHFQTPGGTTLNLHPEQNVSVLNSIYSVVTNNTTTNTGQGSKFSGQDMTDFLLLPLMFVFYGLIVIEIVNQAFSLIHVLPDQVLRWIGGPVQQDRTEQMVQKIGQQVQGAAKELGQVGGSATLAQGQVVGASVSSGVGLTIDVAKLACGGGSG